MRAGEVEDEPIDAARGHAGPNLAGEHIQAFGNQPPGSAHAFECSGAVDLDLSGLALRRERRVNIAHATVIAAKPLSRGSCDAATHGQCKQARRRRKRSPRIATLPHTHTHTHTQT